MTFEGISLPALQDDVREWSRRNFPDAKPYQPLLGVSEELGELVTAASHAERLDAIGDAVIYLADYCARNDLVLECASAGHYDLGREHIDVILRSFMGTVGRLCHAHLKDEQGIRGSADKHRIDKQEAVASLLYWLRDYCLQAGIPFERAVADTWAVVKQRDWQKNKENGRAVA